MPESSAVPVTEPSAAAPARSISAGDERFPGLGSADLDVDQYEVELRYDRHAETSRRLTGTVALTGSFLHRTDQLALDYAGAGIESVRLDGEPVVGERDGRELVLPLGSIRDRGARFEVAIDVVIDLTRPGFSADSAGIFPTRDGLWSVNEPDGVSTWIPVNDHPTDKATWSFTFDTPGDLVGVANGELVTSETTGTRSTWRWEQRDPMATYLVLALIGDYEIVDGATTTGGVPLDASASEAIRSLPSVGWPLDAPAELFGAVSYDGGAVALHALRRIVGDDAFFAGLRTWVARHQGGAATTADFQRVLEDVSGEDLDGFFDTWVRAEQPPDRFPSSDDDLTSTSLTSTSLSGASLTSTSLSGA